MDFSQPQILKRTGLKVGRLGLGAGYGAPATAYEEAFEKGCNYFYWLSRKPGMCNAIQTHQLDRQTRLYIPGLIPSR